MFRCIIVFTMTFSIKEYSIILYLNQIIYNYVFKKGKILLHTCKTVTVEILLLHMKFVVVSQLKRVTIYKASFQ